MRKFLIALFTLIVAFTLFVVLCTFVRKPYERILLDRFGKVIEEAGQVNIAYNWYLKSPFDSVIRIDTRLHLWTSSLDQITVGGAKETIAVRTFAAWRISDPILFYKSTGGSDSKAQDLLLQQISGLTKSTLGNHPLDQFFNTDTSKVQTGAIEAAIAKTVSGSPATATSPATGLAGQGIQVAQIGFSRMAFPASNAEAIYYRMASERKIQARDFITQGESEAAKIKGQAEADAASIRNEAVEKSEKLRGEGDREALRILASVQTNDEIRNFYAYWKSLELYRNSFTANTVLVLPTNSTLLNNLLNNPQNLPSPQQPATLPAVPKN